jgi:hypothetical protein
MTWDTSTSIVDTAVDHVNHNAILQDPSPLNPAPSVAAHTMRADQLKDIRDPSERRRSGEFHIGDAFTEMGLMTAVDTDYQTQSRQYSTVQYS